MGSGNRETNVLDEQRQGAVDDRGAQRPAVTRPWSAGRGVAALLEDAARINPDSPFLVTARGSISYGQAWDQVQRLATWLTLQGVGRGDRVAICLRNSPETAIAVFATAQLGAIFVVLNPLLRPKGLEKILHQAEPKAFIADEETRALLGGDSGLRAKLDVSQPGRAMPGWADWSDAMREPPSAAPWPGIDIDAVSLVFTSGSTADPRGVTLTHGNIRYVVGAIQDRLGYRSDDIIGLFLPLAFDYGLYQVFLTAQARATLYIGSPDNVGPFLPRILREAGVTVLPGVPTVYAALIAMHQRRPFELPRLRAITNTGERLPAAYIERMRRMVPGLSVFPMYGLTECKRVSILLPEELEHRPESVGRPLAGTEVYAVDDAGMRLAPGEAGELVVRGPHVALGYWRAPEETARRYRKRAPESAVELFTGDRGYVDAEGFIFFSGRGDDLIKHRGNRISPVEIEIESCGIDGVSEAAVLKREEDDTLHLFVTVTDAQLVPATILARLGEMLEPAKVPDVAHVVEAMPKSMNGKIDRKSLKSLLAEPVE